VITRRTALAAGLAPAFIPRLRGAGRPPNLLFLIADDHAGYVLGADGNRQALTPNLDALAAGGFRFSSHYCNSPVCSPSRQSLLSGQMPHMAGVTRLRTPFSPEKPAFSKQLRAAGYQTAVFGKMHFNAPAENGRHGFDLMQTEDAVQRNWQRAVQPTPLPEGTKTKKMPWRPFQDHARDWLNAACLPFPRTDAGMKGTYIARQACRYMEDNADKPFALWVSLMEPHSPFDFPVEDSGRFDPAKFDVPPAPPGDQWQIPLIFRDLSPEEKRGIIAAYYTSVHFLDRNWGRVLAKLKELRLDGNTLVVYTADHGYDLGHHGRFEKHCGYDPALRVPLIFSWPGRIRTGVSRDLTEHLDLAPTILDLLGAPPLPVRHGQSLRPYLEGKRHPSPRRHIVSEYLENEEVFVRTDRWKLIHSSGRRRRQDGYETDNPTPGRTVRLFDLSKDPGEFTDVAARNPKVVAELQQVALERFRQTHPEADREPSGADREAALEFYLPPRDPDPPAGVSTR
jgi:choline-sulfatase